MKKRDWTFKRIQALQIEDTKTKDSDLSASRFNVSSSRQRDYKLK